MNNIFCLCLAFIFLFQVNEIYPSNNSGDSIKVVFTLTSNLSPDSTVYITGNIPELGNWNPVKIKMERSDENTWTKEITLSKPVSLEYKFTLGSWEREGAFENGLPLKNLSAIISADTNLSNHIYYWTQPSGRVIKGQVTGEITLHQSFECEGLQNRDVVVWLPPDYRNNNSLRYPVIYMHDGQNIFDPATSSFGVDWQMDEAADTLIKSKQIPPVIIVGIFNTSDRQKEYIPGNLNTLYKKFIIKKLKLFIDSTYRTLPGREHTFTGGSSAGGILSFILAWENPDIFAGAICMSPAFKIRDIDYVADVKSFSGEKKDLKFFISNGGAGIETQLQPGIDEMVNALKEKGYSENEDYKYIIVPEAQHSESEWAKLIPTALKFLLN